MRYLLCRRCGACKEEAIVDAVTKGFVHVCPLLKEVLTQVPED